MKKNPNIGQPWPGQGGIYAGIMRGENGQPDYHLIIAPTDAGTTQGMQWGPTSKETPGADHERDGLANTKALTSAEQNHPAAQWAAALSIEGHADYYLPSRRELQLAAANTHEEFENRWHWSSTQYSAGDAWFQYFDVGTQYITIKGSGLAVRAVRRILIIQ